MRLRFPSLAVPLWLAALALPPGAGAHGTGSRWLMESGPVLAVAFHYSSGEPMAYAKVTAWSPANAAMAFQAGRADANGHFALVPDAPGTWRLEAQDDEGHKAGTALDWRGDGQDTKSQNLPPVPPHATEERHGWRDALLGASLILNLFLGADAARRRRRV